MFRKKKAEPSQPIDPAQLQQFLAFQAAFKAQPEKKKKTKGQQAKPAPKSKKGSRLRRAAIFLALAFAGLLIAFHFAPLLFIELFEAF